MTKAATPEVDADFQGGESHRTTHRRTSGARALFAMSNSPVKRIVRPQRASFQLELARLAENRHLLLLLVRRDLVSRYPQMILGPLWFSIQPRAMGTHAQTRAGEHCHSARFGAALVALFEEFVSHRHQPAKP